MTEEVVTELDINSVDPEVISEFLDFQSKAVDYFVQGYAKYFDKVFGKFGQKLAESEEKTKTFQTLREKHLKDYRKYAEKCLDQQMDRKFADKAVVQQMAAISADRMTADLCEVQKQIQPFKEEFIRQLQTIEQTIDERYEQKSKQLSDLDEEVVKAFNEYESKRKALKKKVLTIITDLDNHLQDMD